MPEMFPGLHHVWEGFQTLNNVRQYSYGGMPQPLQLTEVEAYVRLFPVHNVRKFVELIYVLDREYIVIMAKKTKEQNEKRRKTSSGPSNKKGGVKNAGGRR